MRGSALLAASVAIAGAASWGGRGQQDLRPHVFFRDNGTSAELDVTERKRPSADQAGDVTCMRWTGGSCRVWDCHEDRGPTVCEENLCMCAPGLCADAEGRCSQVRSGEWLGERSIKFQRPYVETKPFVGLGLVTFYEQNEIDGFLEPLGSSAEARKEWNVALTPNGRVRLSHIDHPGSAMTIWKNRRRRSDFLQTSKRGRAAGVAPGDDASPSHLARNKTTHASDAERRTGIPDNDDLYPVLIRFEAAHPAEITFQIRETSANGGGLELWHPLTQTTLASADPEWMFEDPIADNGIAECTTGGDCEGRQLVVFEPALPAKVFSTVERVSLSPVALLNGFQTAVVLTILLGCFCVCCIMPIFAEEIGDCYTSTTRNWERDRRERERLERERQQEAERFRREQEPAQAGSGEGQAEGALAPPTEQSTEIAEAAQRIAGTYAISSSMGNFMYKFEVDGVDPCVLQVSGKLAGAPQFDAPSRGTVSTVSEGSRRADWQDDQGTAFHAVFTQDLTRLRGAARAADGQQMDFTGLRR